MIRFELDGTATLVANEGATGPDVRVGERWVGYPPTGLTATVLRTGRVARVEDYLDIPGGEPYLREGLRSAVGTPIHVNGRLWGFIAVGSGEGPLPPDTEQRMTQFTDLVATAVANAQNRAALETSRDELARLLAEQAALRRVATLVARGIDPVEIFSAVAEEAGQLLQVDQTNMIHYESDATSTVVASWRRTGKAIPSVGDRQRLGEKNLTTLISQTRRPARIDSYADASGGPAVAAREAGFRSAAGAPVIVQGRLWGAMIASSVDEHSLPLDTEARLASFTELVATAIANAENLAELTASRARVVAAADETRRRIERDLHDGTQQRLVSLSLELRLTQSMVPAGLPELQTEIGRVAEELTGVVEDLREIARGIHPAILSEGGLGPALRTLARRAAIAVELDVPALARLPEPVEVAAYYVCSEALTNATRHAHASVVHVAVEERDDYLHLSIRDDGVGGIDPARGSGLIGLRDRVEALGGSIEISGPPGEGTAIGIQLPLRLHY